MSLYAQLGGDAGLAMVVDDFYSRIVADDFLGAWFVAVDHDRLRSNLLAYLAVALGGPEGYTGRSMRRVHGGLRITHEAFDAVLRKLAEALSAAKTEPQVATKVIAVVAQLRAVVVQVPG